jgi:hypothetical protein
MTSFVVEDKYCDVLDVPPALWPARDAAIDFALHGGEAPAGLKLLKEWFADDYEVYENTHSETAANQFVPALRITEPYLHDACDNELRDRLELDEDTPITDEMRISHTRDLLEEDWTIFNPMIVGVATRTIENANSQSCLIGYLEVCEGQSGINCEWEGVFPTEEAWDSHLKENGMIRYNEPTEIPDEVILKIYHINNI